MKRLLSLMVFLALSFANGAFAWTLKTGTYDLSGGNNNWGVNGYHGQVIIAPQGNNYSVIWRIDGRQTQVGVGILQEDILSVAFTDFSNNGFWGVASYRVRPFGELEGVWTSYSDVIQKPEHLVWQSYSTF